MRPDRFTTLLHTLLDTDPQTKAVHTQADAGLPPRHPYGRVIEYPTGARILLQIIAKAADGDRYDQPEQPVEGDTPLAEVEVPDAYQDGKLRLARVDQRIAALLTNSGNRELRAVEAFSTRDIKGAVPYGVRADFHNGAVIWVYVVHAAAAGRDLAGREFAVPATV